VTRPALGPTQSPIQWVPGVKRGRDVRLTTHLHLVPSRNYTRTSSPPSAFVACSGTALLRKTRDLYVCVVVLVLRCTKRQSRQTQIQLLSWLPLHYSSNRSGSCCFVRSFECLAFDILWECEAMKSFYPELRWGGGLCFRQSDGE
jgi:hypothetical protein